VLLAIALFGIIMVPIFNRGLHDRLEGVGLPPAVTETLQAQRSKLAAIEMPAGIDAATKEVVERAIAQSFVSGFRWIMLVSAALAIVGATGAWWMIGSATRRTGSDAAS
jgi:hypothetical protein